MKMFDIRKWNWAHLVYAYLLVTFIFVTIARGIIKMIELCR